MKALIFVLLVAFSSITAYAQESVAGNSLLPPVAVGDRLFVSDFSNDSIYVLEDLNQDGDCNDMGEITVFYDSTAPDANLHLATVRFIAFGPDGALYVGDSNQDFILRLEDKDNDGTALQAEEAIIFYDSNSASTPLVSVGNLVFDEDGYLYFSDTGTSSSTERYIRKIKDLNGDGYCEETEGEVTVVYDANSTAGIQITRTSGFLIDTDGSLIASDYETDSLFRLFDTAPANGNANDMNEQLEIFQSAPGGTELNFAESLAWGLPDPDSVIPFFINPGPTEDIIYKFRDEDADGSFLSGSETSIYWDTTQVDGLIPANTRTLAIHPDGRLFVLEAGSSSANVEEQVVVLKDLNQDGDCNDTGEAIIFADNTNLSGVVFSNPQGMAFELAKAPAAPNFIRGDANQDGNLNVADAITQLNFLFGGLPTTCEEALNTNNDTQLNIADVVYYLSYIFTQGSPPAAPFPACGDDQDVNALGCLSHDAC